jgi:septal ring factor EnvC (AmiA/AmiB activator)
VFKAFQRRKEDEDRQRKQLEDMKKKQAVEEDKLRKQREEEEQARKRMEQLYLQQQKPVSYKPPQSYQAQYGGDNDFFFQ